MNKLETFLSGLYQYLMDSDVIGNQVKLYSSSSELRSWDGSFSLDVNYWSLYLTKEMRNSGGTIFDIAAVRKKTEVNLDSLKEASKQWGFPIINGCIKDNALFFSFERKVMLRLVLVDALRRGKEYGAFEIKDNISLCLADHIKETEPDTLIELKNFMIHKVCENFLKFVKFQEDKEISQKKILFTDVNHTTDEQCIKVICRPVNARLGQQLALIDLGLLVKKRGKDMRAICEEKYPFIKFDSTEVWPKLGRTAVYLDMLRTSFEHPSSINLNDHYIETASVIAFTSIWISNLTKFFREQVKQKVYEPLPSSSLDFDLLNEPEEWELLYVYILRFPSIIKICFEKLPEGQVRIYPLVDTLFSMTKLFNSYYNRVRFLDLPRQHPMPVIHTKILLLATINIIIINSFNILNIHVIDI